MKVVGVTGFRGLWPFNGRHRFSQFVGVRVGVASVCGRLNSQVFAACGR